MAVFFLQFFKIVFKLFVAFVLVVVLCSPFVHLHFQLVVCAFTLFFVVSVVILKLADFVITFLCMIDVMNSGSFMCVALFAVLDD